MENNSKDANCDYCGKLVKNAKKYMKKHKLTKKCINSQNPISIECDICGKLVSNRKRLKEHKQTQACKKIIIKKNNNDNKLKLLNWWDKVQKIEMIDWEDVDRFTYAIDKGNIYTKHKQIIGYYREWCDNEGIILKKYKNDNDVILNPFGGEPLLEFVINDKKQMFQMKHGTHRRFRYDYVNDNLIFTDVVRFI